ncbi:Helix-turn-helix [Terribacillus aidingensis]|uniref:Helix-turn-helix n=1 Tax=Terribacillus aidingensis TaxID=586416 RepID=A0A285NL71_9BACI|nr:helix-turn-helix transcriptional regulator [Terribacillus aidingensis]SNZ09978.1 Helix-turn-helix [Terribacillus aidingensis]
MTGKELKMMRIGLDIKACDIAKKLVLSKQYISMMENDKRPIPEHLLSKWTALLK